MARIDLVPAKSRRLRWSVVADMKIEKGMRIGNAPWTVNVWMGVKKGRGQPHGRVGG
jgi:hypothetical protein